MKIAQRFSAGWSVVQPQSPRSGRLNRPADFVNFSAVRFADLSQCLGSAPSAEALGYSQPSTSPTFEARPPATCHRILCAHWILGCHLFFLATNSIHSSHTSQIASDLHENLTRPWVSFICRLR